MIEEAPVLFWAAFTSVYSLTKVHSLLRLTAGQEAASYNFPEVIWVIFVKVDPVVMCATSMTPASWVLLVLANAAVAVAPVAPKFPGLPQSG